MSSIKKAEAWDEGEMIRVERRVLQWLVQAHQRLPRTRHALAEIEAELKLRAGTLRTLLTREGSLLAGIVTCRPVRGARDDSVWLTNAGYYDALSELTSVR
jgi:hypothetical protein